MSALLRSSVGGGLLASEAETRVAAIVCTTLCHMKRGPLFHRECQKNNRSCIWHTHPVFAIVVVQKTAAASACHDLPLIAKIVPSFCEGTQGVAHLWQYHRHRSRLLQVEDGIFCMLNNSNIMEQIPSKKSGRIFSLLYRVSALEKKPVVILKYTYKKTATVFLLQMVLDGISADCWFKFFKIISVAFCCY